MGKRARKIIVPPVESELFFLTGTFLNNYDVIERKLQPLLIHSTVGKRAKRMPNTIVETTQIKTLKTSFNGHKEKKQLKGQRKAVRFTFLFSIIDIFFE